LCVLFQTGQTLFTSQKQSLLLVTYAGARVVINYAISSMYIPIFMVHLQRLVCTLSR